MYLGILWYPFQSHIRNIILLGSTTKKRCSNDFVCGSFLQSLGPEGGSCLQAGLLFWLSAYLGFENLTLGFLSLGFRV